MQYNAIGPNRGLGTSFLCVPLFIFICYVPLPFQCRSYFVECNLPCVLIYTFGYVQCVHHFFWYMCLESQHSCCAPIMLNRHSNFVECDLRISISVSALMYSITYSLFLIRVSWNTTQFVTSPLNCRPEFIESQNIILNKLKYVFGIKGL